jgi:hypothetical protein
VWGWGGVLGGGLGWWGVVVVLDHETEYPFLSFRQCYCLTHLYNIVILLKIVKENGYAVWRITSPLRRSAQLAGTRNLLPY